MWFFYRIKVYFLWKTVKKLSEGRDGKFAQARSAVKEIYDLTKRRRMTPDELTRYAEAVNELARLSKL